MKLLTLSLAMVAIASACREAERPVIITTTADAGIPPDFDEPPDGPGGTYTKPQCARACAHMKSLKCSDGMAKPPQDSCYVLCKRVEEDGKQDLKLDCVEHAGDLESLRACKSYRCK